MDPGQAIGLRLSQRDEGALEEAYSTYSAGVRVYVTRFVGESYRYTSSNFEDTMSKSTLVIVSWAMAKEKVYGNGKRKCAAMAREGVRQW